MQEALSLALLKRVSDDTGDAQWVIEPMDDDDGARIDVQPGGLALTILLVILTLTFSRLYMYADARLVAAEEDEQSQRLVERRPCA